MSAQVPFCNGSGAPLYCSAPTKELLHQRWPGLRAQVVALEPGELTVLTLPAPGAAVTLNVFLLDANHCLVSPQSCQGSFSQCIQHPHAPRMQGLCTLTSSHGLHHYSFLYLDMLHCLLPAPPGKLKAFC